MMLLGNNSLPQQPRRGVRPTWQRRRSASPGQGAMRVQGSGPQQIPFLPRPLHPHIPVCYPTPQSLLLLHADAWSPFPFLPTTPQKHTGP